MAMPSVWWMPPVLYEEFHVLPQGNCRSTGRRCRNSQDWQREFCVSELRGGLRQGVSSHGSSDFGGTLVHGRANQGRRTHLGARWSHSAIATRTPPPWKLELIDSVLKLMKLYQASELILDFWMFLNKIISSFGINFGVLDFMKFWISISYLDHGFG